MNFRFNRDMVRVMKVEPRAGGHPRFILSSTGLLLLVRTDDGAGDGVDRPGHSLPEPAGIPTDHPDHEPLLPFGRASRGLIADRRSIAVAIPGPSLSPFASGTRPRRRPRVHGFHGAHALGVAAKKKSSGGKKKSSSKKSSKKK
jgi:hypothetical protein